MPPLKPPFYAQEKDSSCLPACLRMILAAYGLYLPENVLRKLCDWTPHSGASSRSVVAAARALGFIHSREDYGMRIHDLRDALRNSIFPIVGIDLGSYGRVGQHAQVVVAVTSRMVRVLDPLLGTFNTGLLTFEEAWSGSEFLTILVE